MQQHSTLNKIAWIIKYASCKLYHEWGTVNTWVVDPQTRRAWQFVKGADPEEICSEGELQAGEIHISLSDIFSVLS